MNGVYKGTSEFKRIYSKPSDIHVLVTLQLSAHNESYRPQPTFERRLRWPLYDQQFVKFHIFAVSCSVPFFWVVLLSGTSYGLYNFTENWPVLAMICHVLEFVPYHISLIQLTALFPFYCSVSCSSICYCVVSLSGTSYILYDCRKILKNNSLCGRRETVVVEACRYNMAIARLSRDTLNSKGNVWCQIYYLNL